MNRRDFNSIMLAGLVAPTFERRWWHTKQKDLRVNGDRINAHLTALSEFGKNPQGGVSRVAYSDFDKQARATVMGWMRAAKLEPTIDVAGNIIGRRASRDASLAERNVMTRHPIEVVIWQNEEDGLFGSRAVSGQLTPVELKTVSNSGKTVEQGIAFIGGDPAKLDQAKRHKATSPATSSCTSSKAARSTGRSSTSASSRGSLASTNGR